MSKMSKLEKKVTNTLEEENPPKGEVVVGRRFAVQFDLGYTGHPGTTVEGESVTVPDLNLTVRQLLENHTRGVNGKVSMNQPLYFDVEIPNIQDITDVEKYRDHLEERLEATKEFIKNERDAKAKAKADEEAEKSASSKSQKEDSKSENSMESPKTANNS